MNILDNAVQQDMSKEEFQKAVRGLMENAKAGDVDAFEMLGELLLRKPAEHIDTEDSE